MASPDVMAGGSFTLRPFCVRKSFRGRDLQVGARKNNDFDCERGSEKIGKPAENRLDRTIN